MITFLDLLQNDSFRMFVEKRITTETKNSTYSFNNRIPMLYKYRPLSDYSIDDITSGRIMATSIGEFNDLFDGAMHNYGSKEERILCAEKKWDELEKLRIGSGISNNIIDHDQFVNLQIDYLKNECRLKFRELDYLGTYVCCLSSKCDSTLMWSHYANSNSGVCVEYDFNDKCLNPLLKNMIFPVAYSQKPLDLQDLLMDEHHQVYQYPLEAAVLCAALNKSAVWSYENEWRLVLVLEFESENTRRVQIKAPIVPKSIILGYHFLKSFFYRTIKAKCW